MQKLLKAISEKREAWLREQMRAFFPEWVLESVSQCDRNAMKYFAQRCEELGIARDTTAPWNKVRLLQNGEVFAETTLFSWCREDSFPPKSY